MYTYYQNERLHNLKKELDTALSVSESLQDGAEKQASWHRMHTKVTGLSKSLEQCFQHLSSTDELHHTIREVTTCCKSILVPIENLHLPIVKPRWWCALTDTGPGVGVSNFEVKFHDAEMC